MGALHPPLVGWIGSDPAPEVEADLRGLVRLQRGASGEVALVLVWVDGEPPSLEGLPRSEARPRVIGISPGRPAVRDRLRLIRLGGDDLVDRRALRDTVIRLLFPDGRLPDPVPAPAPPALPEGAVPLAPDVPGPNPPALVDPPEDPEPLRAYLESLERYLARRGELLGRLGDGGLALWMEVTRQRDLLRLGGESASDGFGRPGGLDRAWPAAARRSAEERATAWRAQITSAGADGLTLTLPFAVENGEQLLLDVATSPGRNVQLLVDCRWQRRVAVGQWQVGALLQDLRLRPSSEG